MAGSRIDYRAVAGTLVVHPQGWDDTPKIAGMDQSELDRQDRNQAEGGTGDKNPTAEASMVYVANLKKGAAAEARPADVSVQRRPRIIDRMVAHGRFWPRSDLVFVDAPGTGFSRIAGKDKEKAFYGVDADAYAFAEFITAFLSKYGQWNSPKYLFGESYGVLINLLETKRYIDFNGVVRLSQILNSTSAPTDHNSIPASICPISCRCRLMRQPPGIITSWRAASRICRRSWRRSSISP